MSTSINTLSGAVANTQYARTPAASTRSTGMSSSSKSSSSGTQVPKGTSATTSNLSSTISGFSGELQGLLDTQNKVQRQSMMFEAISNIMKTMFDTMRAIIANFK